MGREHGRSQTFDSWRSWADARSALAELLPPDVLADLEGTFDFAVAWHGDQVRPTGEPYPLHLLEVLEVAPAGCRRSVEVCHADDSPAVR